MTIPDNRPQMPESASHARLSLGEAGLELLRAHAVDLGDRLLDGVGKGRIDVLAPSES